MNKFDEKYEIRLARYDEIADIMQFIDDYWKKGHILATNRDFFEYEMVVDGRVNFVIAKDRETGKISGLHGFVMASKDKERFDTWGSIWKVAPGSMGLLGLEIVRRLEKIIGTRAFLSIGGNTKTTVPILKNIRRFSDIGKMRHFYCVAPKKHYRIAEIGHYEKCVGDEAGCVDVLPIDNIQTFKQLFDITEDKSASPYKDEWYINHRYFQHPDYQYQVYGLMEEGSEKAGAILICREQPYNGAVALRIVDYIGEAKLFGGLNHFFCERLKKYEYIDFYCYGFDVDYVLQAGMTEIKENDTNIIPNYFAPYVKENIDIWVGSPHGGTTFFKADGDQDRPNYF